MNEVHIYFMAARDEIGELAEAGIERHFNDYSGMTHVVAHFGHLLVDININGLDVFRVNEIDLKEFVPSIIGTVSLDISDDQLGYAFLACKEAIENKKRISPKHIAKWVKGIDDDDIYLCTDFVAELFGLEELVAGAHLTPWQLFKLLEEEFLNPGLNDYNVPVITDIGLKNGTVSKARALSEVRQQG